MNETKFTRGAWVTLLVVIFLFAWGAAGMLYFFTLPTDGWYQSPGPDLAGEAYSVFQINLVGAPSNLQPQDQGFAVEGIPSEEEDLSALADRWQVGQTVQYSVRRNDQVLDVSVPLVSWTPGAALYYWYLQMGEWTALGMLLFLAIAALAFFKHPNDHAAQALLMYAAFFPALIPLIETAQSSTTVLVVGEMNAWTLITILAAYSVVFPPTLLRLGLVFPRPNPIVQRHPWLEYLPYAVGLLVIPLFLMGIFIAGYAWTIISIVGATLLVAHSALTMRDALSRAQLQWGLWGFVLAMLMFLANYLETFGLVSGVWVDVVNGIASLSFSVLGITLGIAILRYRLFDIDIIIRRTLTYVLVTALLLVVFFGSVVLLQRLFAGLTGSGQNEIVTVISTLAIAALFVPLRNWVQGAIDRRFNRKKYDAQRVLSDFATTVRDETDLEKLTARLMQVVDETMQPRSVSVWLKQDRRPRTADRDR